MHQNPKNMIPDKDLIEKLQFLRKELHQYPELSGKEIETTQMIKEFVMQFNPDEIIEGLGKTGIAFVFIGISEGPTVMIRADLDALPISEKNDFVHKSKNEGIGHMCGHDGHMVMVAGLAEIFYKNKLEKGRVVLLFQPAEEIGQGASWIIDDPQFKRIEPDFIIGLHNLPGFPTGSIVIKENTFAAASVGMIIKLTGKTSHAAEPENGNSPVIAMSDIIKELTYLPQYQEFNDLVVATVIHARLGEIAFGTTPGYAEVMATLRAYQTDDFEFLKEKAVAIAENYAYKHKLKVEIEFVEEFPATINHKECVDQLKNVAKRNNIDVIQKTEPFRWSEDFGNYTSKYKGVFWGIGSGEDHAQLHNPDYDFPEEIIPVGLTIYYDMIREIIK